MSSDRARILVVIACCVLARPPVVHADAPADASATTRDDAEARRLFARGVALARAGDCAQAVDALEASIRVLPRPNTYFNLARCEERLGHATEALRAYEAFAVLAEAGHPHRETAEARIRALRARMGVLRVASNVAAEIWVDDRFAGRAPWQAVLVEGEHTVALRLEGYVSVARDVIVSPGSTTVVSVPLEVEAQPAPAIATEPQDPVAAPVERARNAEPADDTPPPRRWRAPRGVVPTLVALAGATGSAFVVAGGRALARRNAARALDPYDAAGREAAMRDVRRASRAADAMLGATVALGTTATVLALVARRRGRHEEPPRVVATPDVGLARAGVLVGGAF